MTEDLKGYDSDDELPAHRHVSAPLLLDGVSGQALVRDQSVPATMIPEFVRGKITTEVPFPQAIAELADLLAGAKAEGERSIRFGVPAGAEVVAIINNDLDENAHIDRIFWSVSVSSIARVVDITRTTLVELVAETRAGTPTPRQLPSLEITERAVDVAIQGNRNRVVINQVSGASETAVVGIGAAAAKAERESRARTLMWWIVGAAAVVSAVAAVLVLIL